MTKITPLQREVLNQISRAHSREASTQAEARIEAEALVRDRVKNVRATTNALIFAAVTNHGISKTAVTKAYANTSRIQTDLRMGEHMRAHGISDPSEAIASPAQAATPTVGLDVMLEGSLVLVTFEHYANRDIADEPVQGWISLDVNTGDMVDRGGDVVENLDADPLFAVKVWSLPEVQAVA